MTMSDLLNALDIAMNTYGAEVSSVKDGFRACFSSKAIAKKYLRVISVYKSLSAVLDENCVIVTQETTSS